ncbi:MAG: hypothetical protein HYW45_01795 [Candidatus Daviesbacteria bacterium]|nr:MAG: hypothetical protein HYW45_01795 [Candidatus Daviesbacteria bacterium]
MNKDREPKRLTDTRPQRNHGTGRVLPTYNLLSRGEGPKPTEKSVDPETLVEEIRSLAGIKFAFAKHPGRKG